MRYTDFNFQSDHDNSKNVSNYVFIRNDRVIYWKSSKQHMVADFVREEKYITTFDAAKEAI